MDENMNVYEEMYDWMRRLVEENTKQIRVECSILKMTMHLTATFVFLY
jgi:hypothetical protein